jgi:hypothetical protein
VGGDPPVKVPRWVIGVVVLWICAISAVSGVGWRNQEDTNRELERQNAALVAENLARREAGCEAGDETREIIRTIGLQVGIASGVTGGEAIIKVASGGDSPPEPEVIEAYRRALTELLEPALTDIVNQLPARRWDPETQECVDAPVAE